jgi:chromosome segregation ATPase
MDFSHNIQIFQDEMQSQLNDIDNRIRAKEIDLCAADKGIIKLQREQSSLQSKIEKSKIDYQKISENIDALKIELAILTVQIGNATLMLSDSDGHLKDLRDKVENLTHVLKELNREANGILYFLDRQEYSMSKINLQLERKIKDRDELERLLNISKKYFANSEKAISDLKQAEETEDQRTIDPKKVKEMKELIEIKDWLCATVLGDEPHDCLREPDSEFDIDFEDV